MCSCMQQLLQASIIHTVLPTPAPDSPLVSAMFVDCRLSPPGKLAGCVRNCIGTNLLCVFSAAPCDDAGKSGDHCWLPGDAALPSNG